MAQTQWTRQTVIEKRLERFDKMGPLLNDIYCYFLWRGRWKETSPLDVIAAKRDLDRQMYLYRFLYSPELFDAYQEFMKACFEQGRHQGQDAKLRTAITSRDGNRREAYESVTHGASGTAREWDSTWDARFIFADESEALALGEHIRDAVHHSYLDLMQWFTEDVGLGHGGQRRGPSDIARQDTAQRRLA